MKIVEKELLQDIRYHPMIEYPLNPPEAVVVYPKAGKHLLRKEQPLVFQYEREHYEILIEDVKLFPQGYSALALHLEILNWCIGYDGV